jgi:acyl-coenzyme A thioesterase PaaI-like protein
MTTVQLQTSFVRPVPKDSGKVSVIVRLLRFGKSLSYGDVDFLTSGGKLAAHATTTYALI